MNLNLFENKYFFAVFSIFMFMYAAQIRQPLPKFMMDLFQNPIFRVGILFLVLVRGYKDPQFSLIVSVAFVLIMNTVNEQLFKEKFTDTDINEYFSDSSSKKEVCNKMQEDINEIDTCISIIKGEGGCDDKDNKRLCKMIINTNKNNIYTELDKCNMADVTTGTKSNKGCDYWMEKEQPKPNPI